MRNNKTIVYIISLLFFFVSQLAYAEGDIEKGKVKAAACAGCHGSQGIAMAPNFPNLAGQKNTYLKTAINAYRNGERNDKRLD